jgi:hypothetical protein
MTAAPSMRRPSGRAALNRSTRSPLDISSVSPTSISSTVLPYPTGSAVEKPIFGWGEKPCEYATGNFALRVARSNTDATSCADRYRIFPLLDQRIL